MINLRPLKRRAALLIAALVLGGGAQAASTTQDADGNMVLGSPRAPVTVAEFASVGCPHCAYWAKTTFPAFKARFIDTGKVRFVLHEMLTGSEAMAAAGFLTARCAGPDHYFQVVEQVYARQAELAEHGSPVLQAIAKDAGLSEETFNRCLNDQAALKALVDRVSKDSEAHKVNATPTFFVGAKRLEGEQTLATLAAAIPKTR